MALRPKKERTPPGPLQEGISDSWGLRTFRRALAFDRKARGLETTVDRMSPGPKRGWTKDGRSGSRSRVAGNPLI